MSNIEKVMELVDQFIQTGVHLTENQIKEPSQQLHKDFSYIPRIGVLGKSGTGKSRLINAISGQEECPVSDVEACKWETQEVNCGSFILIDSPGFGESKERDENCHKLYEDLIPTLDAIIWTVDCDYN